MKPHVRLDRAAFERWLASPEGQACSHRRGRPGGEQRPLISEAARRFGVQRRTIERALARLARRQRLLSEHQPVDPATAGLLLDAAKSFVVGDNATLQQLKMRQAQEQPSLSSPQQRLASRQPPQPPSRQQVIDAMRILLRHGIMQVRDVQQLVDEHLDHRQASADVQLAAIGLRQTTSGPDQTASSQRDPLRLTIAALVDALDAYAAQVPDQPPAVQAHLDGLRQALDGRHDG